MHHHLLLTALIGHGLEHPYVLPLLIMAGGLLLEDAATIFVALLAADGAVSPLVALLSLYAGVILSDLALYGIGRLGTMHRWARTFVKHEHVERVRPWVMRRAGLAVFFVRFMPGLRIPVYLACGFFKLPFGKFFFTAVVAVCVWTTLLFAATYEFGAVSAAFLGVWRWAAAFVVIGGVILIARKVFNAETLS